MSMLKDLEDSKSGGKSKLQISQTGKQCENLHQTNVSCQCNHLLGYKKSPGSSKSFTCPYNDSCIQMLLQWGLVSKFSLKIH